MSSILRFVPQRAREQAISEAVAHRTDQAVTHATDRARAAAIRLHELIAVRSGDWNRAERRKADRRLNCGDCPRKT